jgi:hypothetical protein
MNGLAITGVALLALANLSEATFIIGTTAAVTTNVTKPPKSST